MNPESGERREAYRAMCDSMQPQAWVVLCSAVVWTQQMDTSEMRVLLQGAARIFEAGCPKPGTSIGCPNLSPQHIVRDVI